MNDKDTWILVDKIGLDYIYSYEHSENSMKALKIVTNNAIYRLYYEGDLKELSITRCENEA